jgi:small multidrug resistance pump
MFSKEAVGAIWLLAAIFLDVISTFASAKANGFEDKITQGFAGLLYLGSFLCCAIALKYMQAGILYILWSGIGVVATALLARYFLDQQIDLAGWIGISFIVVGLVVISGFSKIST